ncbi:MAG: helix-turn-helix domain-containing protein [Rickettsiales bacterium]|jgi:DNA-binding transcriptional ArsR family regulator|nr:helix-turn-helix domain-containing protein [Rickettsiales bacterium]
MTSRFQHPAVKDIQLDKLMHALSDPLRREIVVRLMECEGMRCNQSCDVIAPSTLSFHFRILREAGLVRSEKRGIEVHNALRKKDIDKRFPGLLESVLKHHKPYKVKKTKVKK